MPAGPVALGEKAGADPPLVVFRGAAVVVRLHGIQTTRVRLPLESVPNFSEGQAAATLEALGAAISGHARLLDVHADADHNRSVFTIVGDEAELLDAVVAGVACARDLIDLRRHQGAHPRVGVADVVPVVPVQPGDLERAKEAALELGGGVGGAGPPGL